MHNRQVRDLSELEARITQTKAADYDCIIVLRGTPEDYFVVQTILGLGAYPLCVFVNSYFSTDIAWKNVHNLIHKFDLELRVFSPNVEHYKLLVKYSLRRWSDILSPQKLMTFRYVTDLAESVGVRLIISGENQIANNSGKYLPQKIPEHTAWSVLEHDVHTTAYDFFGPALELRQSIKDQYNPLKATNTRISWLFLSDFIEWDQLQQDLSALKMGAKGQYETATFDFCHRAGSSVFYKFHDLLRFQKTGELKVTEQLSREIRFGRIDRETAMECNAKFIQESLRADRVREVVQQFFSWLGLGSEAVKWAIKHRLPSPIKGHPLANNEPIDLYSRLLGVNPDAFIQSIHVAEKEYCIFEKGVGL